MGRKFGEIFKGFLVFPCLIGLLVLFMIKVNAYCNGKLNEEREFIP